MTNYFQVFQNAVESVGEITGNGQSLDFNFEKVRGAIVNDEVLRGHDGHEVFLDAGPFHDHGLHLHGKFVRRVRDVRLEFRNHLGEGDH